MNDDKLINDIEELKKRFFGEDQGSYTDVQEWERTVREAVVKTNAKNNPAIDLLLTEAKARIATANELLMNSRDLTDKERDKAFERRDCYEWLVHFFEEPETRIEEIRALVKDEMETES